MKKITTCCLVALLLAAVPVSRAADIPINVDLNGNNALDTQFGGLDSTTIDGAKLNLGLNNVNNTADLSKPISAATQAALNLKANVGDGVNQAGDYTWTGTHVFSGTTTLPRFDTARFNVQGSAPVCASGAYFFYFYDGAARQCINGAASPVGSGSGSVAIADITNWPAALDATELGYLNGVTSPVQAQISALSASGFSPTIAVGTPSAGSATGPYINSTNNHFIYNVFATGYYDLTSGSYTAHAVTPTLTSMVIGANGTSLTLTGSVSLSVGAGGNLGFDVDCSAGGDNITATYASGAPGTALVYTLGKAVNEADTCNLDYTQPGNGIEATTGGADLASITNGSITNNSTHTTSCTTPADGNIFNEGFIGVGYENPARWTETVGTNGTVDEDYTLTGTGWSAGACAEGLRTRETAGGTASKSVIDLGSNLDLSTAVDVYAEFNVASQAFGDYSVNSIIILKDQYNNTVAEFSLSDTSTGTTFGYYVGNQYNLTEGVANIVKIHLDPTLASSYIQVNGGTQRSITRGNFADLRTIHVGLSGAFEADIQWGRVWINHP